MNSDVIVQALVVASITAVCTAVVTAYISGKIMEAKLKDLTERIIRIEAYLNGLLRKAEP
jgi:hypothetical protein